jgi:hypothetical protein
MTVQGDEGRSGNPPDRPFGGGAMTTTAHWFTEKEHDGFPVEKAALGAFDLSVLYVGGEWQWLVRREGRDVAEGAARGCLAARQQAEAVALRLD